ncbi:oligosaccharide flippase family protein [Pseudomonas chlororaphis]|uniref:oligosaccharide flippase family protein n=1 Tax=Pseudomonas chlororaphis TaxID=587753 RepID=UPI001E2918DD|nr:oligosaccharide flippase family protein [Pseudomonas chlororaphis]MCB2253432.1 oligosaccharide flippase family protein [Pseudomonas chlororaphis]
MTRLLKNMGLLFFVQLCGYLIPILEIPVLARALGVQEYGKVVLIQSVALLTSLVVEYGFSLSGSRQVAISRDDKSVLARIFGEVLSAKLLIFSIVAVLGFFIFVVKGNSFHDSNLVLMGFLYFVAFGFSPFWFFQGLERITLVVVVEVSLRFTSLLFLYMFIHGEQDALLAFGIMSGFGLLNTIVGNVVCVCKVGKFSLSLSGGLQQIKIGFHVFVYKSSNNILMSAGPSLVGLTSGHVAVASYVPAEKIIRGFVSFVNPILIGFYPYLNRQFQVSQVNTIRLSWMIVIGMLFSGVFAAGLIYFVGDFLIFKVLGAGFTAASEILKVFVWVIPFRLANQALGLCMLIPMGRDKATSFLMMLSSVISMLLAALLSIWYGVAGVVSAFVLVEAFLFIALIIFVLGDGDKKRKMEGV